MKVKSDSSAQIMYIKDTGEYKIIVDTGNIIYVFDTPADATLEQLTDYKSTGDLEKDAIAKAGIYTTTSKEFNSGFFKNDKLVSVPLAVNQITQSVADDAQDVLKNFFDTQKTISETYGQSNQLWTDDEYLSQIAILSARFDGDLEAAQDAFEKTPAYGSILQRLGLSQARLNAEKMLKTDPIGFQNVRNENINYLNGIVSASGGDIPDTAVFYLGDLVAKGLMSLEEAKRQISGATDMYSPYRERLDAGFKNALGGGNVKVTTASEDTVQNLLDRYLPKNLHGSINIAEEAGNIRSNPNYQQSFINKLKKQRYAIYNMYDEDIDWNIILNSKKQAAKNVLGVELKEDDIALDAIIRMNDSTKEQEYLRELGLERGYNKVKNDLTKAMMATFGSGVVQSRSYVG
jgi:hypothetical protein